LKLYKVSEKLGFPAFFAFMKELYAHCRVTIEINNLKEVKRERKINKKTLIIIPLFTFFYCFLLFSGYERVL